MEEDLILQQPSDRRLGNANALPPGPPGAEFDALEFDAKNVPPKALEKESMCSASRSSRRRSPSVSPARKRQSASRTRRSPSSPPPTRDRRRRSPSPLPRRNRYRDYSPDRRRYDRSGRRSPDRRRSPPPRDRRSGLSGGRDRYRGRARSSSRSLSRSPSPIRNRATAGRWSPKKKPSSPPPPQNQQLPMPTTISQQPPNGPPTQPPPQYSVMTHTGPQLYGDAYGQGPYNQYGVPPPQPNFVNAADSYGMPPQTQSFNAAYPPPGAWSVDTYGQQQWLPPPNQLQTMPAPPPQQQQQTTQPPPPMSVVGQSAAVQVTQSANTSNQSLHTLPDAAPGTIDPNPAHDAVAQEAENQRDELKKQRTSYLKKTSVLKKELKMLKEQRKDLHKDSVPPSPTTKGFIDENEKLQNQIQKKLSTIENVIDMLTGIIGEENLDKEDEADEEETLPKDAVSKNVIFPPIDVKQQEPRSVTPSKPLNKKPFTSSSSSDDTSTDSDTTSTSSSSSTTENEEDRKPGRSAANNANAAASGVAAEDDEDDDDDSSAERLKNKVIESMKNKQKEIAKIKTEQKIVERKERFNYVFYDPEMHWCQTCDIFPKTARDYLDHLHSPEHMDRESIDTPWHLNMITNQFPTYENAPTKRTPIRGLTFFVPASAWFCKLCSIWMGDLHCASTHLKSQLHANRYNAFLEENPHYEVNWLADRQRVLNEKKTMPLPPQITSISTTAGERKKTKKDDDKPSKKRKKKSDKKQKKKKKKSSKKRKKSSGNVSSSSCTSDSSSSTTEDEEPVKKKHRPTVEVKELDNPNPAASIRVTMRKQETLKHSDEIELPALPPSMKIKQEPTQPAAPVAAQVRLSKWTVAQESTAAVKPKDEEKHGQEEDNIIQQWNTVQPVISESEKKLLEQLKGKLKNKPKQDHSTSNTTSKDNSMLRSEVDKENREKDRNRSGRDRDRSGRDRGERDKDRDRDRDRERRDERDRGGGREEIDRRAARRSRTRSPTRSCSRGRDYRRFRRSRSRSRGRISPRGWRGRRGIGRGGRSRSRSPRRRSRSYDRSRRRVSRSRTRTRSRSKSNNRIEKPVVRQPEFRPRVPEKDKEKEKKSKENTEKKEKSKSKSSNASTSSNAGGKKLPFIGKMPVFKKQVGSGQQGENGEKRTDDQQQQQQSYMYTMDPNNYTAGAPNAGQQRPPAPTAAQIQLAMMEDAYGNAPPFHPDVGMMVDYDDLMPDPAQFVNIMGQAPPPPPPPTNPDKDEEEDMLPPGIDQEESEEFVPKPITDGPAPTKGPLPKDLEEALNIIFPGEKKPDDGEGNDNQGGVEKKSKLTAHSNGETQIIVDEPVLQAEELAKEGIHLVTLDETSIVGLDEASQMSMNEPLVFNKPTKNNPMLPSNMITDMELEDAGSQPGEITQSVPQSILDEISPPLPPQEVITESKKSVQDQQVAVDKTDKKVQEEQFIQDESIINLPEEIPMPDAPISEVNPEETNNMEPSNDLERLIMDSIAADATNTADSKFVVITNEIDLADIPQPPPSPTESEKNRRQEELNDLAMLGIDADDMAAQCM
ncbi:zinc finger matrin-type protein CG9776 isoform 1-T2 [Glossina fuscipes fuscipes]